MFAWTAEPETNGRKDGLWKTEDLFLSTGSVRDFLDPFDSSVGPSRPK